MSITLVSGSNGTQDFATLASSWDVTGPIPNGLTDGDYMIISLLSSSLATETPPAGWELLAVAAEGTTDAELIVYGRTYVTGDTSPWTVTFNTTENGNAAWAAFRGVHTTSPIEDTTTSQENPSATAISTPSRTITHPGACVVGIVACDPDVAASTFVWDSPATEIWDVSGSSQRFQSAAYAIKASAGSISLSGTISPNAENTVSTLIALRPAAAAAATGAVNVTTLGVG